MTYKAVGRSIINYAAPVWSTNLRDTNYRNIQYTQKEDLRIAMCRGLCACTEMWWMCVLYVSFSSKVRPRTFGCVGMGSALLRILGPDCSYFLQGLA